VNAGSLLAMFNLKTSSKLFCKLSKLTSTKNKKVICLQNIPLHVLLSTDKYLLPVAFSNFLPKK
jgi:hypothetical protein